MIVRLLRQPPSPHPPGQGFPPEAPIVAVDGFVLDAHPDPGKRAMVLWVKDREGRVHAFREPFTPRFYVRGAEADLADLKRALEASLPALGPLAFVERTCGLEFASSRLLEIPVPDHDQVHRLAAMVDGRGEHKRFELFDVDLRMSQRYFIAKRLFPFAGLRVWAPGRYTPRDDPWSVDYPFPDLRVADVAADPDAPRGRPPTHDDPVRAVTVAGETYAGGDEADRLRWLAREVAERDPDVVITEGGDAFLLAYLAHRARVADVAGFKLGREADPAQRRRERSYFTYGKIKYQPASRALAGRLHLDRHASFFLREAGLAGVVDLSRVSGIPLQDLARLGAGTAVTAVQIDRAAREGRVIPWKKNAPEAFKTARDLLAADRGAYIYEPVVGLHEDVVELDFASLFPNIMIKKNLSAETILCECCAGEPSPLVVPQLGYHVCSKRSGFVGRTIGPIVARRERFKRLRKEDPANRARYQSVSDAYKWCLVTSFGYQGYRNAKFGRIECHEAINAWGREILLTATEVARDHGFEILHGIVDSLWLKRVEPWADAEKLSEAVHREIGIPFEYQGRYNWIVFLPNRSGLATADAPAVGALNRYYGCFDAPPDKPSRSQAGQSVDYIAKGAVKARGVELRQHSTPRLVREAQERALETLAGATDAASFRARIPAAIEAAGEVAARAARGDAALADLLFVNAVAQDLEDYRARTLAQAALTGLAKKGVRVAPGDVVRYVVLDNASRDATRRVVEARLLKGDEAYDRAFYERAVLRGVASLLLPFGWTEERLADALRPGRQRSLAAYA